VRFREEHDGSVPALEFREDGEVVECARVGEAASAPATISLDELHALRRSDERARAVEALGAWRVRGRARFVHMGIEGSVEVTADGPERFRVFTDLSPYTTVDLAVDGESVSSHSDLASDTDTTPEQREWLRADHPALSFGDWRVWFDSIRVLRADERGGRPTWVVRLQAGERAALTVWVDAETGDTLFEEYDEPVGYGSATLHRVRSHSDHREVEGLRIPFRSTLEDEYTGLMEFETERFEVRLELSADALRIGSGPR
jgi:hypothetical protein